jgi:hypothetical protein
MHSLQWPCCLESRTRQLRRLHPTHHKSLRSHSTQAPKQRTCNVLLKKASYRGDYNLLHVVSDATGKGSVEDKIVRVIDKQLNAYFRSTALVNTPLCLSERARCALFRACRHVVRCYKTQTHTHTHTHTPHQTNTHMQYRHIIQTVYYIFIIINHILLAAEWSQSAAVKSVICARSTSLGNDVFSHISCNVRKKNQSILSKHSLLAFRYTSTSEFERYFKANSL